MTMETMTTQDNGVDFVITITEGGAAVDISEATCQVQFRRPGGDTVTRSGALNTDGTDGKMLYQSALSDFTVSGSPVLGVWQYRPVVMFIAASTQYSGQAWHEFELVE